MRICKGLWRSGHSVVLYCGLFLTGCGGTPASLPVLLKNASGFQVGEEKVGRMTLAVVRRMGEGRLGEGARMRIYIEGDGRAYITKSQPSGDPTPVDPVGLRMALADGGRDAEVVFVGRPCQWVRTPECRDNSWWTTGRFTEEVAQGYADLVARLSGGRPVELVGYSGGAWVVLQVASRVPNVTLVRTVAGNVDPVFVHEWHKVNTIEVAGWGGWALKSIPQVHDVGGDDAVVVPDVVQHYIRSEGPLECGVVVTVPGFKHGSDWAAKWPELLRQEPCVR